MVGIGLVGAVGAVVRFLADGFVQRAGRHWPWGTFVVNVTGSFVLGLITGAALYHGLPNTPKLLLGTGFCGAYTTFSTFTYESVRLVEEKNERGALINAMGSLAAGISAAALGLAVAAVV